MDSGNFDDDDEFEPDDSEDKYQPEPIPRSRESVLDSRRRIEDLQELRRMRKLLEDDEFELDFN